MAPRPAVLPLTRDASLVILAGGRSSRMGRAKAELPVGDLTLLEWMVRRLGPGFAETIVSGAKAPPGARTVDDRRADAGPLAGIEAALTAAGMDVAFVVACDMPRASDRLARLLIAACAGHDAAVPRTGGRAQPTCAAYARSAIPKLAAYLDAGGRRATAALDALDAVFLEEGDITSAGISLSELADLDTPADYQAFLASFGT